MAVREDPNIGDTLLLRNRQRGKQSRCGTGNTAVIALGVFKLFDFYVF